MSNQSFSGKPKNVALQEQRLVQAQKQLDRIEKMRADMAKQVELEMERLSELRKRQEDFTQGDDSAPHPSNAAPSAFQSQYDQFSTIQSNQRLTPMGNQGAIDFTGKLEPPQSDTPVYRSNDRDEHYQQIDPATDLGKDFYVSGYYYSSGQGTKEYEYELRANAGSIRVGDMVEAPVHLPGWHEGRTSNSHSHDRRFIVTDIYNRPKFPRYHDKIG